MSAYMVINNDYIFRAKKRNFASKHTWCARCARYIKMRRRTIDHIIPMSIYLGSPEDKSNWQMLCVNCHRNKTKRIDNKIYKSTLSYAFANAKPLNKKGTICQ